VTVAFLSKPAQRSHVRFVIAASPTNQNVVISQNMADLLVVQPPKGLINAAGMENFALESGWFFQVLQVYVDNTGVITSTAADIVKNSVEPTQIILQVHDKASAGDVYDAVQKMLIQTEYVQSSDLIEKTDDILGTSHALYDIVSVYNLGFDQLSTKCKLIV
jgi:hypothetical protein